MTNEKLIHVKLEYRDSIKSKRDVLSLEMSLLKTIKIIKKYHEFRFEEFKLKKKLYIKIKTLLTEIRKLKENLPKSGIPKVLEDQEAKSTLPKEKYYGDDIESQLGEIQDKLDSLQARA